MNKLKRLIERGYFPSQLPPPFTTASFAASHAQLATAWPRQLSRVPSSRGEYFSVARAGHSRRPITIPNPVNQFYLSRAIADHWRELQRHFRRSRISLSRPTLKGNGNRATEVVPLSELSERRLILSSGFRYVLRTDISRFFPTLYTHSVPWSLHGKAASKANPRDRTPAFFGNVIDYLVQGSQERQTIGIPIGPDTSHIVSETIATAVDLRIRDQLGRWPVGYRHVDDFFLCFNTSQEAQTALAAIVKALREFELDINPSKTSIAESETLREDYWVERLQSLDISESERRQRQEIHRFFGTALSVAREDENAIRYALKISSSNLIAESNWELYESYLLRCGLIAPNCMQTVVHLLVTYHSLKYPLNIGKIRNFCSNVILPATRAEHHSEVVWALWLACELSMTLPAVAVRAISEMQSSICALVTLDLRQRGLVGGRLDTSRWDALLDPSSLKGPMWMLAYEASLKGWLRGRVSGFVGRDVFFGAMQVAGISFYDPNERLQPLIRRLPAGDFEELEYEFANEVEGYAA